MEGALRPGRREVASHGAGAAHGASFLAAIAAGGLSEMGPTGRDIVAAGNERAHRAGIAAGRRTRIAGSAGGIGQGEPEGEGEGGAEGDEEAAPVMDEKADRRDRAGAARQRPADEGMEGRSAEGIEDGGAEALSDGIEDAPRPAVERIGRAVARLGALPEERPEPVAIRSREDQREAAFGRTVALAGMEPAEDRKAMPGERDAEGGEIHAFSPGSACPPHAR